MEAGNSASAAHALLAQGMATISLGDYQRATALIQEALPLLRDQGERQRKTLDKVFEAPTRSDIFWSDIESLCGAAGATVSQRAGSRVSISLAGITAVFHAPHPQRQTPKATVEGVRDFLERAGVTP
jgi:hypothetical protein